MRWRVSMAGWIALGCGPDVANGDGSASGGESSTSVSTSGATHSSSSTTSSTTASDDAITSADTSTSTSDDTSSSGGSFIQTPDALCSVSQCDVWAQDCGDGEKCVPYSSTGDGTFGGCSDSRCSELDPDPRAVGETCTIADGPWSGVDDCDISAFCWNVDPDTNQGVCVAMCAGSEANPACEDEALSCFQYAGTSVIACVPSCDALAPECPPAMTCAMSIANDYAPLCISQSLDVPTGTGTDCHFALGCGSGFACVAADSVPGCAGDSCCTPVCDLATPQCPPEQSVCTQVPSTAAGVGACVIGR